MEEIKFHLVVLQVVVEVVVEADLDQILLMLQPEQTILVVVVEDQVFQETLVKVDLV